MSGAQIVYERLLAEAKKWKAKAIEAIDEICRCAPLGVVDLRPEIAVLRAMLEEAKRE